ncbi:hypothetical protein AKO1_008234 [Acrasis kona]|uniref:Uncharacterized protein n=1 Tax=Acrasis kona TaxID=1008807 RepID=A0AAW2YPU4_9EUKA
MTDNRTEPDLAKFGREHPHNATGLGLGTAEEFLEQAQAQTRAKYEFTSKLLEDSLKNNDGSVVENKKQEEQKE